MSRRNRAGDARTWLFARLAALPLWLRGGVAGGLGALATLALPPHHFVPALLVAATGLLWLLGTCAKLRAALFLGWLFGVGFFGVGLAWLANAFYVEADRFGAFAIPAVAGLAIGLAVFVALAAAAAWYAPPGWRRAVAFALAWTVAEWLRGHLLTGFPWNLVATVWAPWPAPAQFAAIAGVYGLGFATMLAAALPSSGPRGAALAAAVVGALWLGGAARLPDGPAAVVPGVTLRVVQGNVAQHHKWRAELREAHLARYVALSRTSKAPPRLVVWPETAVPYFVDEEPELRALLAGLVAPDGVLLTGAVRRVDDGSKGASLFNGIQAIDARGAVVATYDKAHLVPFGEYTPLRAVLSAAKLTAGAVDFSAGPGLVTWALPGLPAASPLVCYEAIFPGRVTSSAERPAWLLNVTNDAWFGLGAGPRQHFAAVRLRAIEEGLPLVRAANTGISAIVDPYGRVVAALDLGAEGVIDALLPAALGSAPPYARAGDLMLVPILGAAAFALWWRRLRILMRR
ncbi:MAG: apolipoprotein N-acyltransferase [Alphaproteobacteria bacterium]